jgi:hypothetical protein
MLQCPKCRSTQIHRSRSRSTWEVWRKQLTSKRPYRCDACSWRGWGEDTGLHFDDEQREVAEGAIAPEPPDLKSTVLAEEMHRAEELDFAAIDSAIKPVRHRCPSRASEPS